jgi:glutamine synthetase
VTGTGIGAEAAVRVDNLPAPGTTTGEYVLLGIPDVHGQIRGKALRPAMFDAALEHGARTTDLLLGLDPTDTPITDYERFGIRTGAADLVVRPEPDTVRELSWLPGWRICIGTPTQWADGAPCELSTRQVLRRVLDGLGYDALAAIEYEVTLRDGEGRAMSSGISYSLGEIGRFEAFMERLKPALDALGVELVAIHTEAGPGLLELNVAARPALRAGDDCAYLKLAVKEVAASLGLQASFLAKTRPGEEGSSGHVHLSCWREGDNAFSGDRGRLESAVAGILDHLAGASLLLNPTINSYKRLIPGWFAPINASWGEENRSCAVRAIRGPGSERCRLECRRPGADANPYLAIAALVAAAADGLRRGAEPPPPVVGDAYARDDLPALPASLESAIVAFEADSVLREALGENFSDYYLVSRRWELKAWQHAVSDWERERYTRAV